MAIDRAAPAVVDGLRAYGREIEDVFLSRQRESGLLPASTASTHHGDYRHAWVRDNVYSILAAWGLSRAWRRIDPEAPEAERFEAASTGVMRGLLAAMMAQADRVERFKRSENPLDALHAKVDADDGRAVVPDDGWGHLQIDATGVFLLQLAQMTRGGLQIVRTRTEADFVQNLVHYIGPAYRTPDYGIWERGDKANRGEVEINASSVGLAKAALEAMDGLTFDGIDARPVLSPVDDIARARETLEALLPHESASKETDGALFGVIGYPAYAVEDAAMVERTRSNAIESLSGRYGCKRFLLDGHQTAIEDAARLHYEPGEMASFADVESEWPLFYAYLAVDAAVREDRNALDHHLERLDGLAVMRDGYRMLPELFRVQADRLAAERAAPGSQPRESNENVPLYWAQSLWTLARMAQDGLLTPDDLDPLRRRRLPGSASTGEVRLAFIASDAVAADALEAAALPFDRAEALDGGSVSVLDARRLEETLADLGANAELGLSGRVRRLMGGIVTCRIYVQDGRRIAFLSPALGREVGPARFDPASAAARLHAEIVRVSRHWRHAEPAVLVVPLSGDLVAGEAGAPMRRALSEIGRGAFPDAPVRVRRLSDVASTCTAVSLDGLPTLPNAEPPSMLQDAACLLWVEGASRMHGRSIEPDTDADTLVNVLTESPNLLEKTDCAEALLARGEGSRASPLGPSVSALSDGLWEAAARRGAWAQARRLALACGRVDDRLSDMVKEITVRMRTLVLPCGARLDRPTSASFVRTRLAAASASPLERSLLEETLIAVGGHVRKDAQAFTGVRTIRLADWVDLIQAECDGTAFEAPPHAIDDIVARVLKDDATIRLLTLSETVSDRNWAQWRARLGVLTRVAEDYFVRVWRLMERCEGLVVGFHAAPGARIDCVTVRADHTPAERKFASILERRLDAIPDPSYRALTLEAMNAAAAACEADAHLRFSGDLSLDVIIHDAVRAVWPGPAEANLAQAAPWSQAFALSPTTLFHSLREAAERHARSQAAAAA